VQHKLMHVMYSFLIPFFPLDFWDEFLTRHTHGIYLAKGSVVNQNQSTVCERLILGVVK